MNVANFNANVNAAEDGLNAQTRQLQARLQQEIATNLGQSLNLDQCKQGYIRLPTVPKKLYRGSRGALFYVNQKGNRVFLNTPQKARLAQQRLPGVVGAPPVPPPPPNPNAAPQPRPPRRAPNPNFGLGPPGGPANPVFLPDQVPQRVFAAINEQLALAQQM